MVTSNRNSVVEIALTEANIEKKLKSAVVKINDVALAGKNEATIASTFEIQTTRLIVECYGIEITPEKEVSVTQRLISRGRIDSSYGTFIIEFKQPSTYKTVKQKENAANQLEAYLTSLFNEQNQNVIGIVTDGIDIQFIRFENGFAVNEARTKLDHRSLLRIIRLMLSMEQIALTPTNLIRDFCQPASNNLYKTLSNNLYKALSKNKMGKSTILFDEWRELFRLAHDDDTKQLTIQLRKQALASLFSESKTDNIDEYRMLYALQTTYAIIVKLIAFKVLSDIQFGEKNVFSFKNLSQYKSEQLRQAFENLEEGAIFRKAGIINLLEGDFFSWYTDKNIWSTELSTILKECIVVLAKYEDKLLVNAALKTQDLFHELYENIIPFEVRHSLGEFYTPSWLADMVIEKAFEMHMTPKNWRAIDPCAGSGTFITRLIEKLLVETEDQNRTDRLNSILNRVVAIDLNPLAVLTSRVNYFINIAHLIDTASKIHIPVYLGDSTYIPQTIALDSVECLNYQIKTLKGDLNITFPRQALSDGSLFAQVMASIEFDVKSLDPKNVSRKLLELCNDENLNELISDRINQFALQLVEMEKKGWNGIWSRIVSNFLLTGNLGKFDFVVGNPPWIDWKNLPEGYRDRIKAQCISRDLFSGDRVTGGINLNICALIANVSAENWLLNSGTLAFLMPSNILVQKTYEGFRKFTLEKDDRRLYLQQVFDFKKSGNPFKPVTYDFSAFYFNSNSTDYDEGVPLIEVKKVKNSPPIESINGAEHFSSISKFFNLDTVEIATVDTKTNAFSRIHSKKTLQYYRKIAGECSYVGREGIEFYPQEMFLLIPQLDLPAPEGSIYVKNFQNSKSKYQVPEEIHLLETKYLYPLIRGKQVQSNHINLINHFVVPFPYTEKNTRLPLSLEEIEDESPLLAKYLLRHKALLESQTNYNARIIGKTNQQFYALARVGKYSFSDIHVVYRDNSKWCSAIAKPFDQVWGEIKRPLFQNHAPSICERTDGKYIDLEEAHYVSSIFNLPIVEQYILNSSDSRTFKVRPPVNVPLFDPENSSMLQIVSLHKMHLKNLTNKVPDSDLISEMESLYLSLL